MKAILLHFQFADHHRIIWNLPNVGDNIMKQVHDRNNDVQF